MRSTSHAFVRRSFVYVISYLLGHSPEKAGAILGHFLPVQALRSQVAVHGRVPGGVPAAAGMALLPSAGPVRRIHVHRGERRTPPSPTWRGEAAAQRRGRAQVQRPERGAALHEQERERQEEQQPTSLRPLACGERGEKRQSFLRSPDSQLRHCRGFPAAAEGRGQLRRVPVPGGAGAFRARSRPAGGKQKGKEGHVRPAGREGEREAEGANRSVTWRLFSLSARALLGAVVPEEEEEAGGGGHSARGRAVSLAPGQDHSIAS